jgi:hypothetical protein
MGRRLGVLRGQRIPTHPGPARLAENFIKLSFEIHPGGPPKSAGAAKYELSLIWRNFYRFAFYENSAKILRELRRLHKKEKPRRSGASLVSVAGVPEEGSCDTHRDNATAAASSAQVLPMPQR